MALVLGAAKVAPEIMGWALLGAIVVAVLIAIAIWRPRRRS